MNKYNSQDYPVLSEERDGRIWLENLEASPEYQHKWLLSLARAEITGLYSYAALVKALQKMNTMLLQSDSNSDLQSYIDMARIIGRQEYFHYRTVSHLHNIEASPVQPESTLSELDLNERRSLKRLSTIFNYSKNQSFKTMAQQLIIDEVFHCWYTNQLLTFYGDITLEKLDLSQPVHHIVNL